MVNLWTCVSSSWVQVFESQWNPKETYNQLKDKNTNQKSKLCSKHWWLITARRDPLFQPSHPDCILIFYALKAAPCTQGQSQPQQQRQWHQRLTNSTCPWGAIQSWRRSWRWGGSPGLDTSMAPYMEYDVKRMQLKRMSPSSGKKLPSSGIQSSWCGTWSWHLSACKPPWAFHSMAKACQIGYKFVGFDLE